MPEEIAKLGWSPPIFCRYIHALTLFHYIFTGIKLQCCYNFLLKLGVCTLVMLSAGMKGNKLIPCEKSLLFSVSMKTFILWVDLSFYFVPNDFCVYECDVSLRMWNSFRNIGMGGTICEYACLRGDQRRLFFSPLICCIVGIPIGWSLDQDKPFYPYVFYAHSDPCLQKAFENLQWCLNLMSAFGLNVKCIYWLKGVDINKSIKY